jgi:hypothetical protein
VRTSIVGARTLARRDDDTMTRGIKRQQAVVVPRHDSAAAFAATVNHIRRAQCL